ncbi:MAG: hypothetical protein H6555_12225 [Lewinellaceae bacterium]|nr:hypothetical protein [Lewinellaceae bacterium]
MTKPNKQPSLGRKIGQHGMSFFFCVILPAFITGIAPISTVQLTRTTMGVQACVSNNIFFVIPVRQRTIDPVVAVGDKYIGGQKGSARLTRAEDEGYLLIEGQYRVERVPVSPVNLRNLQTRADDFLQNEQLPSLKLWCVANWKFSVLAGGLVSLLTLLYLVGISISVARWVIG